jgi:uracil-DNA glycosylase family 4
MSFSQPSLFEPNDERRDETIDQLNAEIRSRVGSWPELAARPVIPGFGEVGARVAVVGESPGPPDIQTGSPFTGPAGEMLDRMLGAIGLDRSRCYLTNTVKVVTTGEEITKEMLSFFTPYLHRELSIIRPEVIISFGNTPTRALLGTKLPISQLRGEFHDYHGSRLMPTFNPAYLLRDPTKKREAWEDMKKVRSVLSRE